MAILAPVLDSLFGFYAKVLRRPLVVGDGQHSSRDERALIRLLDEPGACPQQTDCSSALMECFHCALCSTRLMLASALARSEEPLQ